MAGKHPDFQRKPIVLEYSILLRHQAARVAKFQKSWDNLIPLTLKKGEEYMQDLLEICCGLDIHKESIVACLLTGATDVKPTSEIRTFSTMAPGLVELKAWLHKCNCHHVAMESTGIYWVPVYETLEDESHTMHLLVVNAGHMKNIPGKN